MVNIDRKSSICAWKLYIADIYKISQEKIDEVIQTFNNCASELEELEKY